jgi:hypothetical protein
MAGWQPVSVRLRRSSLTISNRAVALLNAAPLPEIYGVLATRDLRFVTRRERSNSRRLCRRYARGIEGLFDHDYNYVMASSATGLPLKVQLSKADLFRATLRNQIHQPVFWMVPFAVICVALTSFRGNALGGVTAVCVGLALLAIMPLAATRASAKNPGVLSPITYVFDDFGVSAIFINGETRAEWSLVTGAFESSRYIFVSMQRRSFHLIPKSQVDERELASLRSILRNKLGTKARRIR